MSEIVWSTGPDGSFTAMTPAGVVLRVYPVGTGWRGTVDAWGKVYGCPLQPSAQQALEAAIEEWRRLDAERAAARSS